MGVKVRGQIKVKWYYLLRSILVPGFSKCHRQSRLVDASYLYKAGYGQDYDIECECHTCYRADFKLNGSPFPAMHREGS